MVIKKIFALHYHGVYFSYSSPYKKEKRSRARIVLIKSGTRSPIFDVIPSFVLFHMIIQSRWWGTSYATGIALIVGRKRLFTLRILVSPALVSDENKRFECISVVRIRSRVYWRNTKIQRRGDRCTFLFPSTAERIQHQSWHKQSNTDVKIEPKMSAWWIK